LRFGDGKDKSSGHEGQFDDKRSGSWQGQAGLAEVMRLRVTTRVSVVSFRMKVGLMSETDLVLTMSSRCRRSETSEAEDGLV